MVLSPTLIGHIVQFLFQVNMSILVFSALMLSPLVSHQFLNSVDSFFAYAAQ